VRYHLGLLYGKCDRLYDGIRELERATELNPRQYPAWKNVAVLYQQAGFRAKAVKAWERAADIAPDEATRQAIRQQIAALG
jgi:tetratricopeptide (TPR) repeat protein